MRNVVTPLIFSLAVCGVLTGGLVPSPSGATPHGVFFRIQLPQAPGTSVSGRLLVFLKHGSGDKEVDAEEFRPEDTWVTAREIPSAQPGSFVEVNGDEIAFPKPFSELAAGDYEVQAVLDVNHSYNYGGREPGDWISGVKALPAWQPGAGAEPTLVLDQHPAPSPHKRATAESKPGIAQLEQLTSKPLTKFWGHPTQVQAWVILPPNYAAQPKAHFPTVYWTHGFGGNLGYCLVSGMQIRKRMEEKKMPPMIWVMLDEAIPQGTHEFADSVNNGPWGTALTSEFLPYLEHKYRMDARPTGRFLNGHSSGGWATLQLQVNFPQIFGGTWSTSPDPSDFHDFTGANLYAPHANVYHKPDGSPMPIMRDKGKVLATLEQFSRLEAVLGPYGGQMSSFDWVFSPKGADGAPKPMFDRRTGVVDAEVVQYWHDHYDLAYLVKEHWPARGRYLKGRIHLTVGTADTFYLDGSAHLFEAVLKSLGAEPHFTYLPDRTHMDLYAVGNDRQGLLDQIAAEMYAVARPAAKKPVRQVAWSGRVQPAPSAR